jgi:hypothetical protein
MATIYDSLPADGFLLAGGQWGFQVMGRGEDRTVWVDGLHWPGCDDATGHGSIGFGVQRPDKFLQFNASFWEDLDLDYTFVRDVAERVQRTGDPGDVPRAPVAAGEGPGVQ